MPYRLIQEEPELFRIIYGISFYHVYESDDVDNDKLKHWYTTSIYCGDDECACSGRCEHAFFIYHLETYDEENPCDDATEIARALDSEAPLPFKYPVEDLNRTPIDPVVSHNAQDSEPAKCAGNASGLKVPHIHVLVPHGTVLVIRPADVRGDPEGGEIQVHNGSDEHPDAFVVKETAGVGGSIKGEADEVIYEDYYGNDPAQRERVKPEYRDTFDVVCLEPRRYDRDNDEGAAQRAIDATR